MSPFQLPAQPRRAALQKTAAQAVRPDEQTKGGIAKTVEKTAEKGLN
ncbi:MAG TPA: hypothetical protein VG269_17660 [Tepidisphaeraceae bacterium]|jgi:hypothetical protein|nr:hypothetical protein [Tepidisphaeraceae bacterium]